MERAEAEAIYEQGRETVVAVLLRMDEQIQQLTEQVAKQDKRIAKQDARIADGDPARARGHRERRGGAARDDSRSWPT